MATSSTVTELHELLRSRVVVFDGGAGTFFQTLGLSEEDYRNEELQSSETPLKGNNDLLQLTKPEAIRMLHRGYLENGADIIETNTFCSNRISQADYGLERLVKKLNLEGARIAVEEARRAQEIDPLHHRRFVAGSIGPTNKSASTSADVSHPESRPITFDELVEVYTEQVRALVEGGVDLLLIETVFDTINCKAAIAAIQDVEEETGRHLPIWISVTLSDMSARTLSGQTPEAFWVSVQHCNPLIFGFNCSLGVSELQKYVRSISPLVTCNLSIYPNAGLPEMGVYPDSPEYMAHIVADLAREGFLNVVGGCCGTRKEHIGCISKAVKGMKPRAIPKPDNILRVSGLEHMCISPETNFVNIGEQCNVAGSRLFLNKIKAGKFEEAVITAKNQIDSGALLLDINMDDSMLDGAECVSKFVNFIGSDPNVARVPLVIDSSNLDVIKAGLCAAQGKCVVNSISLKEGEEKFLQSAKLCRRFGAAIIVMAFDEEGQAVTAEHKVRACSRAFDLLVNKAGVPPQDIIFDANILMICSGMAEHNDYAVNFIDATRILKQKFPYSHISGGVSNLSFAFRSNAQLRQAMHAVFLYHAIKAGMGMGLVNAARLQVYESINPEMRTLVEEAILNTRPDASERLIEYAKTLPTGDGQAPVVHTTPLDNLAPSERLTQRVITGNVDGLKADVEATLAEGKSALLIVEGPLMAGMTEVGEQFGSGKMFLPQVLKAARVMKEAVAVLKPYLEVGSEVSSRGKIVIATVKGDVHDIGKNIVGIVLSCNGLKVVDLGVMCTADKICNAIVSEKADLVGVSGLITPSLDEMAFLIREIERRGIKIPVLVGGATTSPLHTALKLAPLYSGAVIHSTDASRIVGVVTNLLDPEVCADYIAENKKAQEALRQNYYATSKNIKLMTLADARAHAPKYTWEHVKTPNCPGITVWKEYSMQRLIDNIDWSMFFQLYRIFGTGKTWSYPRIFEDDKVGGIAKTLYAEAQEMIKMIVDKKLLRASGVVGIFPANSVGDDVEIYEDETREKKRATFNFLRQQIEKPKDPNNYSMSDFVGPRGVKDYIAVWAVTSGLGMESLVEHYKAEGDLDKIVLLEAVAVRLAESFALCACDDVRKELWGFDTREKVEDIIRPAFGYPSIPDHTTKKTCWDLLDVTTRTGITLTETMVMQPVTSVCGVMFSHPDAQYFALARIGDDQLVDFAKRKGVSEAEARVLLSSVLPQ